MKRDLRRQATGGPGRRYGVPRHLPALLFRKPNATFGQFNSEFQNAANIGKFSLFS